MELPTTASLTGVETPDAAEKKRKREGEQNMAKQQASATAMAQPQAPAPAQTFAQLQASGRARPAPPAPAAMAPPGAAAPPPGMAYGGAAAPPPPAPAAPRPVAPPSPQDVQGQVRSGVMSMLANPSYYNDEVFQKNLMRGAQDIDDRFTGDTALLKEEMARRGLSDSSIYGGRSQDLNVARRTAGTDLMERLATEQARAQDAGRSQALGLGMDLQRMGYEEQRIAMEQARDQINQGLEREKMQLQRELQAGNMTMQQAELAMRQAQMAADQQNRTLDREFSKSKFASEFGLQERSLGYQKEISDRDYGEDVRRYGDTTKFRGEEFDWRKDEATKNRELDILRMLGLDTVDYGEAPSVGGSGVATGYAGADDPYGGAGPTVMPPPQDYPQDYPQDDFELYGRGSNYANRRGV